MTDENKSHEAGDRFIGQIVEKVPAKTQDGQSYEVSASYDSTRGWRVIADIVVFKMGTTDVVYESGLPEGEMGTAEKDIRDNLQEKADTFSRYLAASSSIEDFCDKIDSM